MSTTARSAATILTEASEVFSAITALAPMVDSAAVLAIEALRSGGKLMFCGNGGSAADAQHLAAEFMGRFLLERSPWPAIALTTNTSALTAIGNDYGYDAVFVRQLQGLARPGDVLVGLSTSGRSRNVVAAFEAARGLGVATISLTGRDPGPLGALADVALCAPSASTPRIQEMHIALGHAFCEIVESALVASGPPGG